MKEKKPLEIGVGNILGFESSKKMAKLKSVGCCNRKEIGFTVDNSSNY